jgi:hypothetical protein
MLYVQSSPPLRCLPKPLIARRRRHQELEKNAAGSGAWLRRGTHHFFCARLSKFLCENCTMLPRFMDSQCGVSVMHPTDLAS